MKTYIFLRKMEVAVVLKEFQDREIAAGLLNVSLADMLAEWAEGVEVSPAAEADVGLTLRMKPDQIARDAFLSDGKPVTEAKLEVARADWRAGLASALTETLSRYGLRPEVMA